MWGTVIGVDVRDPVEPALIDDVFAWFQQVDDLFSTWRADSEISRLAAGHITLAQTSPDVRHVLHLCDEGSRLSGGA
jgi:FAD:protein FMN transferase